MTGGADPFVTDLFGGSPKMAMRKSDACIGDTTVRGNHVKTANYSSGRETRSSSERSKETLRLCGDTVATGETARPAWNVRYSETRGRSSRLSLSDRLTPSLISSGLVCGITPLSIRLQSGQQILAHVFGWPGGVDVEPVQRASSSLSGEVQP